MQKFYENVKQLDDFFVNCVVEQIKRLIMASEIRNPELWRDGELKIEWVRRHMPLLAGLEKEFK